MTDKQSQAHRETGQKRGELLKGLEKDEGDIKKVMELYDGWAPSYDRDNWAIPYYALLNEHYIELLDSHKRRLGNVILDLGCGTGIEALWLAGRGFSVIGLDISLGSLRVAKNKAKRLGTRSAEFVRCDIRHLPFRDGSASSVISLGFTLGHVREWRKALAEASRVLRAKGTFIVEFDNKWKLEFLYYILDALTKGALLQLGFPSLSALRRYLTEGIYCWTPPRAKPIPFYAVSPRTALKALDELNLKAEGVFGVHIVTLLVPAIVQEKWVNAKTVLRFLRKVGRLVASLRFVNLFGSSLIVVGTREVRAKDGYNK